MNKKARFILVIVFVVVSFLYISLSNNIKLKWNSGDEAEYAYQERCRKGTNSYPCTRYIDMTELGGCFYLGIWIKNLNINVPVVTMFCETGNFQ